MNTPRFRRFATSVALLTALDVSAVSARGEGQQPGGASPVTVAFRALSADGQPVTDLKPGDVALKVDGRAREIKSLELVDLRKPASAAAPAAVPPPFTTNAAPAGGSRDVYLLVDEESIAPGKDGAVKEAIGHYMATLSPNDRMALISVRQGGPNLAPTNDLSRIKTAAASLAGYASGREENANDMTCRTVRTILVLHQLFGTVRSGVPSTVVFFSSAVAAMQAGRTTTIGGSTGSSLCEIRTEQMNQLGSAAQISRASFYVVELTDSGPATQPSVAAGGLDNLAGVTSGEIIRVSAGADTQMKRIADSTASYYLVGFEPEASDRSAGNKRVELTVARSGVMVKAPREMSFAKPAVPKAAASSPKDMIRVPTAFNDLPLRAVAYSSRNPGDNKIRVLALFEAVEPGTELNAAIVGMYDKGGKLQAQWTAQASDLAAPTTMAALLVPEGTYRMRVAATDKAGRAGSVDITDFPATLTEAGPIKLGDLVLGRIGQTGPAPAMQFGNEPEAIAIVELYGRPTGPLKMYVEVLNTGGDLIQVALSPSASNEPDKFLLSAKLPIATLKPGDYAVRAVVAVEGQPDGTLTRTLRKTKPGS